MNRDAQDKRITSILQGNEDLDFDAAVKVFYEYLKSHLLLPCNRSRRFQMGRNLRFGPGNEEEYDHLKKTQPSYTDQYELLGIDYDAKSGWMLFWEDDIGADDGCCPPFVVLVM